MGLCSDIRRLGNNYSGVVFQIPNLRNSGKELVVKLCKEIWMNSQRDLFITGKVLHMIITY